MKKTRKEIFEDYDGFVEKFKPKKTSDDCYTPLEVYQVVRDWVNERIMPLDGVEIVRPFYPGGDFESFDYPPGAVVIDNPPFSILAKIRRFLHKRGIKYFLFAPGLTLMNSAKELEDTTYVIIGCPITYDNGAEVPTGFVTNMLNGDPKIIVAGDLSQLLDAAQKKERKKHRSIIYPLHVVSAALLRRIAVRGVSFEISAADCVPCNKLDNFRGPVFGGGYFISERAAAERAALSDRELIVIQSLGNGTTANVT